MRKKLIIFGGVIVAGLITALTVFNPSSGEEGVALFANAEQGDFIVEVTTTGELSAERSTNILGPIQAREYNIRQLVIQNIVDEGTTVRQGDFVAQLDNGELYDKIQAEADNLDKELTAFENAKLDTALTLRAERDKLINLDYQIAEKDLQLEQSQYEPPATIKKYQNELEKLKRDKERGIENYDLKQQQAVAKMADQSFKLNKVRDKYKKMKDLLTNFTIKAPQDGMVIYAKGFDGNRIGAGSQISTWAPTVATLPDLSSMISTTYINEVDIRKVKRGQQVEIGLDAFPEKKLTGRVIRVASVGQQNPNSDAKVFEVTVRVNERDGDLRPAMTTSNLIITQKLDSVISVPLECLHVFNDSINYVIKKNGTLQEVKVGLTNSNFAVVEMGVEADDVLYLSVPASMEGKEPKLIPELDGTRQEKYEINDADDAEEEEWLLPDGKPMSPEQIQRIKGMGISTPAEWQERMKQFRRGGGQRGGQRPSGGQRGGSSGGSKDGSGASTRSGQPNK